MVLIMIRFTAWNHAKLTLSLSHSLMVERLKDLIKYLHCSLTKLTNMQTIKTQSLLDSEAINALSVDKDALTAQVEFKGGERYTYRNVTLKAIQQLLDNPQQSIGAWVNNNLVDGDATSFVYGYELA